MGKNRLEAFSDGVLAIIITIMVLEIKTPEGTDFVELQSLLPIFLSYLLSFIYIGIYWNNHHHMLHTLTSVSGPILWANLHLLFYLSLVPFATSWMGENHFAPEPTALYGIILLLAAVSYWILQLMIIKSQGKNSLLAKLIGRDIKGKISILLYVIAIPCSFHERWIAWSIYTLVALIWIVPDKRIEKQIKN